MAASPIDRAAAQTRVRAYRLRRLREQLAMRDYAGYVQARADRGLILPISLGTLSGFFS